MVPILAHADYPDNFDTYTPGIQNPGPWHFVPDDPACWPLTLVENQVAAVNGSAQTPPNVFDITLDSSCAGDNHVVGLWINMNASSPEVNFTVYWKKTVGGAGVTASIFTFIGDTVLITRSISTLTSSWDNISGRAVVTPGQVVKVGVNITVVGGGTNFDVEIDTTNLIGGNAVITGANLFLVDYASQQWFDISSFPGSSLRINYASAFNCASFNMIQASSTVCTVGGSAGIPLNLPDLLVGLSGATLITVNVGGPIPYTRTIIPPPNLRDPTTPSTVSMYLDVPTLGSIFSYTLSIEDLTQKFIAGSTEVFISQGGLVITSGLLDTQSHFGMTMQPGLYTITLLTATNSFSSSLTLTASDNSPTLLISSSTVAVPVGPLQQFQYSLGWDCDLMGATSSFTDTLGTMSTLWSSLYRSNASGTVIIYTNRQSMSPVPGTPITGIYDFRNSTISQFNIQNASQYSVGFNATLSTGSTLRFGPFGIYGGVSSCPSIMPNQTGGSSGLDIPPAVLGLSQIFTAANAYEELLALMVIIFTAAIFGARMAHIGMLVVGMEMGLFYLMTWLPIAAGFVSVVLFIGSIGILVNRARRPIQ